MRHFIFPICGILLGAGMAVAQIAGDGRAVPIPKAEVDRHFAELALPAEQRTVNPDLIPREQYDDLVRKNTPPPMTEAGKASMEASLKQIEKEGREYRARRAQPVDWPRVDPVKLVRAVSARMAARIRYAESSSVRSIDNTAIYATMGFKTAEAFCRARDPEYQLLEELAKESQK